MPIIDTGVNLFSAMGIKKWLVKRLQNVKVWGHPKLLCM